MYCFIVIVDIFLGVYHYFEQTKTGNNEESKKAWQMRS